MGESKPVRIARALGAAVLVAAAATVLTSCSALGGTPAAAGETASGPVLDPSVPSASPTEIVASDTPAPIDTATSAASSEPSATATATPLVAVVPYITTASYDSTAKSIGVAAIVPGVVEGGGSCVVTISSGSSSRTLTGDGVAASSYTGCEAVTFKAVAAGAWQVRVRYESKQAAGSSAVRTVTAG